MKKKINFLRFIWVSCLFLTLIVILLMVMDYKINYEYLEKSSGKVYFYECGDEVCTTEVKDDSKKLYSTYDCWYNTCPIYKGVINDDYALLKEDTSFVLYNYKTGDTITSGYDSYTFINKEYIIVTKDAQDGIIDINDNVIVKPEYDQIGYFDGDYLKGYSTDKIIASKNDKYGIISFKDGRVVEEFKHSEAEVSSLLALINK